MTRASANLDRYQSENAGDGVHAGPVTHLKRRLAEQTWPPENLELARAIGRADQDGRPRNIMWH